MTTHATGAFDVQTNPQAQEAADGLTLARLSLDKQFHGDLEGVGKGEMLAAGTDTGIGLYVAVERVTGTLQGRRGSFVLVHKGTMSPTSQELAIEVMAGSGIGELAGLAGTLAITITEGKHFYDLEYTLEPGAG